MRPRVVLVFLAWVLAAADVALASPPRLSPEAAQAYREAHQALARGDYAQAQTGFRNLLGITPLLRDYVQYYFAESLLRGGAVVEARQEFQVILDQHAGSRWVPTALLKVAELSAPKEAEGFYRRYLERFPEEVPRVRLKLGEAIEAQGRLAEAAQLARQLWLEHPAAPEAERAKEQWDRLVAKGVVLSPLTLEEQLARARRLEAAAQWAAAVRTYEELTRGRASSPELLHRLGLALGQLRRWEEGILRIRQALEASPASLSLRQTLRLDQGKFLGRLGRYPEALAVLEELTKADPFVLGGEPLLLLGRYQEELAQPAQALATYARVIQDPRGAPQRPSALLATAWIHYRQSAWASAKATFQALAEWSDAPWIMKLTGVYWLGRSAGAGGQEAAAQSAFRRVMELAPRSYYGILAGRRLKAVEVSSVKAAPVALPQSPETLLEHDRHFLKGRELHSLGFADDALAELDLVRKGAGADRDRLYALSLFYYDIQEPGRALPLLRRHFGRVGQTPPPGLPFTFWRALYPLGYSAEVEGEAWRNGLEPAFVAAVIREESSYDPKTLSPVGARGLMQLMPDTARLVARALGEAYNSDPATLHEVRLNIRLGTRYLATLMTQFGEPALVAAGYNAGPHRVVRWWGGRRNDDLEEWIEAIPFDETRAFVKRVLTSWEEYRRLSQTSPIAP